MAAYPADAVLSAVEAPSYLACDKPSALRSASTGHAEKIEFDRDRAGGRSGRTRTRLDGGSVGAQLARANLVGELGSVAVETSEGVLARVAALGNGYIVTITFCIARTSRFVAELPGLDGALERDRSTESDDLENNDRVSAGFSSWMRSRADIDADLTAARRRVAMLEAERDALPAPAAATPPVRDPNEWIDDKVFARDYDKSRETIQGWRWRGTGPDYKHVGRSVRYQRRVIEAWIDEQTLDAANRRALKRRRAA